jgi:hypothetical protein
MHVCHRRVICTLQRMLRVTSSRNSLHELTDTSCVHPVPEITFQLLSQYAANLPSRISFGHGLPLFFALFLFLCVCLTQPLVILRLLSPFPTTTPLDPPPPLPPPPQTTSNYPPLLSQPSLRSPIAHGLHPLSRRSHLGSVLCLALSPCNWRAIVCLIQAPDKP